jgi:perosamine synthetase
LNGFDLRRPIGTTKGLVLSNRGEFSIPLMVPNLCGNELKYLEECLETNQVSTLGDFVPKVEELLEALTGSSNVIATNSGTSALHAILAALGIGIGDLVIVQDYTFIATANAVSMTGASVWILGVNPETRSLDPELLQDTLKKETRFLNGDLIHTLSGKIVRAIIQTFTDGHPGYVADLHHICKEFSLPLIIDGAGALGCEYNSQKLGNLGDAQIVSFNGNKTFTAGSGGAALIQNDDLAETIRTICSVGRTSTDYKFDRIGFNYRMANVNAAICLGQLENYDQFLDKKRDVLNRYKNGLSEFDVSFLREDYLTKSSCWTSNILISSEKEHAVDKVLIELEKNSIQARVFWKPLHLQTPYGTSFTGITRVSEQFWDKVVTLPCSTSLREADQSKVLDIVREALVKK